MNKLSLLFHQGCFRPVVKMYAIHKVIERLRDVFSHVGRCLLGWCRHYPSRTPIPTLRKSRIIALGRTWREMDINSPPRTFKNQHLLERPPRAIIDHREGRNGTNHSERSFGKLTWVHTNATEESDRSTRAYLARNGCH